MHIYFVEAEEDDEGLTFAHWVVAAHNEDRAADLCGISVEEASFRRIGEVPKDLLEHTGPHVVMEKSGWKDD